MQRITKQLIENVVLQEYVTYINENSKKNINELISALRGLARREGGEEVLTVATKATKETAAAVKNQFDNLMGYFKTLGDDTASATAKAQAEQTVKAVARGSDDAARVAKDGLEQVAKATDDAAKKAAAKTAAKTAETGAKEAVKVATAPSTQTRAAVRSFFQAAKEAPQKIEAARKAAQRSGAPLTRGKAALMRWLRSPAGKTFMKRTAVGVFAGASVAVIASLLLDDKPGPGPRPTPTPDKDEKTDGEPGGPGPNAEECKSIKGLRGLLIDKAKEITGKTDNVAALTSLPRKGENSWIRNTFRKLVSRRVSRSEKEKIRSQITKKYGVELGCVLPKDKAMTELEKAHAALVTALEKDNEKPSPFKGYGTGPSADTITKAIRKARAFGNKKLATDVVKARAEMQDLLEDLEDLVKDSSGASQRPAGSPGGRDALRGRADKAFGELDAEEEKASIMTQLKGLEKNQRNLSQIQSLTRRYLQLGGKMKDLRSSGITENLQEIVPVPRGGMSRRGTPENPSNVGFLSTMVKTVQGAKRKRFRDTSNNVEKVDKKLLNLISQILKIDTDAKGNKIDLKKFNQVIIGRTKPRKEMAEEKQKTLKEIALSILKENKINKQIISESNRVGGSVQRRENARVAADQDAQAKTRESLDNKCLKNVERRLARIKRRQRAK